MDFEWDENKNSTNVFKHGIDFKDALAVFNDPNIVTKADTRVEYGERRFHVFGLIEQHGIIMVVHTIRYENTIRIISARKANRRERRLYNPNFGGD
jgi:uncharacterized DUF497 family protein